MTDLNQSTTIGSIANIIRHTLTKIGVPPEPIFLAAGIDYSLLELPDVRFSVKQMQKLWKLSTEASDDLCFGLTAGQYIQPAALHGIGLAWLASDTHRSALQRMIKYSAVLNTLVSFSMEEQGNEVEFIFSNIEKIPEISHASTDFALMIFIRMLLITSPELSVLKHVYLIRPPFEEAVKFENSEVLKLITFNSKKISLVFDKEQLDQPLLNSNKILAHINEQIVADYIARFTSNTIHQMVRAEIVKLLPTGNLDADIIAKSLYMSKRTMHRKLTNEGWTYRRLLKDVRGKLAEDYLLQSKKTSAEISYLLGFSEPANFTRAFTQWKGNSPAKFRRELLLS